jgi:hypothetical protein
MGAEIVPFPSRAGIGHPQMMRLMALRGRAVAHIVDLVRLLKDTDEALPAECRDGGSELLEILAEGFRRHAKRRPT